MLDGHLGAGGVGAVVRGLLRVCLSLLGVCPHDGRYRELRGGVLHLVCDHCGDAVPAIARSRRERREMAKRFRAPVAARAQRVDTTVVAMPKRRVK